MRPLKIISQSRHRDAADPRRFRKVILLLVQEALDGLLDFWRDLAWL
jgi:hypothetical protein